MGINFGEARGSAKKGVERYQYKAGDNTVRLVGDLLPRYVYWVTPKGQSQDIPIECLSFDRVKEQFTNTEKDHVKDFFPDKKCGWAYVINCIDPSDGKIKALPLKKKLLEQIMIAAEDLGDPTHPDTGWNVVFRKTKTGPLAINVSYDLLVAKCKVSPLTEEQKEALSEEETIDEKFPRPTPEEVLELLESITKDSEEGDDSVAEHASELSDEGITESSNDIDDDIPL